MRLAALAALLAFSLLCRAEPVNSVREAWAYVAEAGRSERWIVISSTKNPGYFQCENRDAFVLCPIPVWISRVPGSGRYAHTNARGTPYPEIPGSKQQVFLSARQVVSARTALRRMKLSAVDVYSQIHDEERRIIGTAYEVRIALDFNFNEFEKLVDAYMQSVWNTSARDGYAFQTN